LSEDDDSLIYFCQEQALNTELKRMTTSELRERIIGSSDKHVDRELDEIHEEMEEPPRPNREKKERNWADMEY
jgi:malate synthase